MLAIIKQMREAVNERSAQGRRLSVAVAHPAAVATCKNWLLALLVVVALVFVVLASTARVEATAAADLVSFVWPACWHCVPVHSCKGGVLREQCSGQEGLWSLSHMREVLIARLCLHHAAEVLRHRVEHAVAISHLLLLAVPLALLLGFLFEQGTYADTASLRPEVATKSICTGKTPATAPVTIVFEITTADELLLTGVKTLMSFPVVLTSECFPANTAYEWTLVRVSAQM